jgi:uncharacterized caspase-like protein
MVRVAAAVLLSIWLQSAAQAQGRFALLIGNQSYNAKVGPLKNPHNDIVLIGAALERLGFKIMLVKDADYKAIDTAIKRHIQTVRREGEGAVSFFYYSGHGAADPDTKLNYLIPVDVANADDDDLWTNSLNLNNLVEGLRFQAPAATHYVVFDACRNELNLTRKGKKALGDKGFVPIAYTPGVLVAYATAPGKTADDRGSDSGPYAKALAEEILKPGVEAMTMFRRVSLRVNREIGQDPWMSTSTLPEIYFAGVPAAGAPPPPVPAPSEAERAWSLIRDSTSLDVLKAFIARYADSFHAELARARIEELRKQQAAVPPSPPVEAKRPVSYPPTPSQSEINTECSKRADAKQLHGEPRKAFRARCKDELARGRL